MQVREYAAHGINRSDPGSDQWRGHGLNGRALELLAKLEDAGFLPFHIDLLHGPPKCCHAEMTFFNTRAPERAMPAVGMGPAALLELDRQWVRRSSLK